MLLGKGKEATRIHVLSKSPDEIKTNLNKAGLVIKKFSRIANPDAKIDPSYENKYEFRKNPIILVAQKLGNK